MGQSYAQRQAVVVEVLTKAKVTLPKGVTVSDIAADVLDALDTGRETIR
ncbi:MAG TPA: DUF6307 family protein [Mycobacteriales bacterium]|nr:DUF6307 family protein [Mycobacteriales bacterium]